MRRIVYEAPDGGVCIVVPTGEVELSALIPMVVPAGAAYRVVDDSAIPDDRGDRESWRWSDFASL